MSIYDSIKLNKSLPLHEDYSELMENIEYWNDSIDIAQKEYNEKYIFQGPCEHKRDWKYRQKITSPRRIMQSILEKYMSNCFKNPAERTQSDFFDNVDMLGTSMRDFMKFETNISAICGASYFMPDNISSDQSLTVAQKRILGNRVFVRHIENSQVVNWKDIYGNLMEVLITFEDALGTPFALYYDSENMSRIELDKKGNVVGIGELVSHGYSRIPIIRMLPWDLDNSFVSNGCDLQKSINNILSLHRVELFRCVYTKLFGKGIADMYEDDGKTLIPIEWGPNQLLTNPSPDADIKTIGSDVNQGKTILESFQEEIEHLYKQYHISSTAIQSGQVPSGYSLIISREDFNNTAKVFVKCAETAENTLIMLLNESENLGLAPTEYSYSFIENNYQEEILELRDLLALNVPQIIKNEAVKAFSKKFFNISLKDSQIVPQTIPEVPKPL
jgi:hypothetical protein